MPYFGSHFLHVAVFCLFLQNKLNIHLDEHFIQSNLRFIYLADYQHGGGVEIIAQARCYTTNYNKAEQLYRQGRYAEAKRYYKAASACPDKPKQNNIAARISACDNAIREREEAERRRKLEEMRQSEAAKQEFIDKYVRTFTVNGISLTTITVNGVSFTMILVEGGTFTMGDNSEDYIFYDDRKFYSYPATEHQVTLSDYYIGQTEVTQALWEAVMGYLPDMGAYRGDNKPVTAEWDEWQEFIDRLNELTGLKFRRPTEAEWEYAAMGGNRSRGYIFAGSNDLNEVAWYKENSGGDYGQYHPVATKKPNELYLYDMSGNANECVSDWFAPYSTTPQTNPTGPHSGKYRIVRGASAIQSISSHDDFFRIKKRYIGDVVSGLRLALSAE